MVLVQETDETKRQMLFLSLAQEEAQLKALLRALSANAAGSPLVPLHSGRGVCPNLQEQGGILMDRVVDQHLAPDTERTEQRTHCCRPSGV
jgi:hypothetical protein